MVRDDADPEADPLPVDERRSDRRATDESLREERTTTDEALGAPGEEPRAVKVVRERRDSAQQQLRAIRADGDAQLDRRAGGLPEVSTKLEQVANSLSQAAASLTGVAESLKDTVGAAASSAPVDLVSNIAEVAKALQDTAESAGPPPAGCAAAASSGKLAQQLAEVAEGIAEVSTTLAEERRDVDEHLRQERLVTDRILVHEMEQVEATLATELREERDALRADRQETDDDLANERRNTDQAVDHVVELLAQEKGHHEYSARRFASRNEFLSIVSHDLRGPLMAITGVASLIEQQAGTDDAGRRLRALADRVQRSVGVMDRLIRDLLDFGSFEDGQLRVAAECLDIRLLLEGTVDAFHAAAEAKGVLLAASLPADPVMAKYDPHRMLQVMSNLVHNAIKFTPKGGSIQLHVARTGTACQVSVSDTGIGIPESELKSVFERFRQLNRGDRTGFGLGLYISLWIVEAHGGRIWAESTVGAGTTIHFTLPED